MNILRRAKATDVKSVQRRIVEGEITGEWLRRHLQQYPERDWMTYVRAERGSLIVESWNRHYEEPVQEAESA